MTATNPAIGASILFTGYTSLPPGEAELLKVGQTYTVQSETTDGGLIVVDENGVGDTIFFPDECSLVETAVKAAKATKTSAKAPAKAKAEPKAKAAPKAKTPVKAKTTPKTAKAALAAAKAQLGGEPEATIITPTAPSSILTGASAPITDTETVTKLLHDNDALTAAKSLALQAEETFYSLGGVLSHVYSEGLHKTMTDDKGEVLYGGKRGFGDYMLGELNINYRKGMYLIQIYTVCRKLGVAEEQVARIGWSKMREIINKMEENPGDVETLLDKAANGTREELTEHVRTTYVNASSEKAERVAKTRLTFNLFGDDTPTVQRALEAAKTQVGPDATPEQALVLIAAEWSQLTESVDVSLEEALRAVSARFGVEVGVITAPTTDEDGGSAFVDTAEAKELVDATA